MTRKILIAAAGVVAVLGIGAYVLLPQAGGPTADPRDPKQVAEGRAIYAANCSSCHGNNLEGQANWKERKADGKLPAPPQDATGHTWHHPDRQLFDIVKRGVAAMVPNYPSDMAGFGDKLSDREIWSVLAYIKSTWPADIQTKQASISEAAAK